MRDEHAQQTPAKQLELISEALQTELSRFSNVQARARAKTLLSEAEKQLQELKDVRTKFLGKKSGVASLKKLIGRLPSEERAAFGQKIQQKEDEFVQAFDKEEALRKSFIETTRLERESIDVTIPGRRPRPGHLHPITLMRQRIEDIFVSLGYAVEDDREIETDFYNFDALNIPEGHPARDPQDTFYTTDGFALRSQTSTVQIHAMQRRGAPVRMIAAARAVAFVNGPAGSSWADRAWSIRMSCARRTSIPNSSPVLLSASASIAPARGFTNWTTSACCSRTMSDSWNNFA